MAQKASGEFLGTQVYEALSGGHKPAADQALPVSHPEVDKRGRTKREQGDRTLDVVDQHKGDRSVALSKGDKGLGKSQRHLAPANWRQTPDATGHS
jgi:hypothetical protein